MEWLLVPLLATALVAHAARRGKRSLPLAVGVALSAYILLAEFFPRFGDGPGMTGRVVWASAIVGLAYLVMPRRRSFRSPTQEESAPSAPTPAPVTPIAPAPPLAPPAGSSRGASSVAELVAPRHWGGSDPGTDEALTLLAEHCRDSAAHATPEEVEEALAEYTHGWSMLAEQFPDAGLTAPAVRERVEAWFQRVAETGGVRDGAQLWTRLQEGSWRAESVGFKGPSHGRISAARLLHGVVTTIESGVPHGHLELPGFGAFSLRSHDGELRLMFHDDSVEDVDLSSTAFVPRLAESLECTPKTATNAGTKFFTALLEQIRAHAGANVWVVVPGLGMFSMSEDDRLQFVADHPLDAP